MATEIQTNTIVMTTFTVDINDNEYITIYHEENNGKPSENVRLTVYAGYGEEVYINLSKSHLSKVIPFLTDIQNKL